MATMSYEKDADYQAQWLFPPSLEDLLPGDHPARMVREFVEAQDLKALGFKTRQSEDGRPNYSSALMLKVWLYGYVSKIRSTRGVERACMESIGMLWLTGMLKPDHTTLWRFWRDNQKPIRKVFKQLLQVAASFNLVGMVLHAVDGTKVLSQASQSKGLHRSTLEKALARLDEAVAEIMKQTEETSRQDGECRLPERLQERQELRSKIQEQLNLLNKTGRDHVNPGDQEARLMKCRGGGTKFAYNAQAVVDQQSKLIVAADVVTDESDNYQLVPMLDQVAENLGKVAEHTLADGGYEAISEFAKAEVKGYSALVNIEEAKDQPYHASRFTYDAEKDHCVCPRGEALGFDSTKTRNDKVEPYQVRIYRCQSYQTCPVRWQCSKSKSGRTVQIHPNYDALVRQREKLKDERLRALLRLRGSIIEPLFGWSKEALGFRRWTVRGLEKVKTQWALMCTAMNLRRLHRLRAAGKLVIRSCAAG
jgi:transposase